MAKFEVKLENIDKNLQELKECVPTKAEMRQENLEMLNEWWKEAKKEFVSIDRFNPVEKIAYGLVGAALLTFAYAVFRLVVK